MKTRPGEKIKMLTPLVEMDGDEMTRILWQMIKDELLNPFIELNTENSKIDKKILNRNIIKFLMIYNILLELDRESALKLHYNDLKRVIRALEIYHSGTKKSDIIDEFVPKYNYKAYSINHQREFLYKRINNLMSSSKIDVK